MKSRSKTDIRVQIQENVLKQIVTLCKGSQNEIFGYLIGFFNPNEDHLVIKSQIYVENAVKSDESSTYQINGTAGEFNKQFRKIKDDISDDLLVVGWWHSHIGLGCFLSATDIQTQETFFPYSHHVAMVIDPIKDTFAFFTLDKNSKKKYKKVNYQLVNDN